MLHLEIYFKSDCKTKRKEVFMNLLRLKLFMYNIFSHILYIANQEQNINCNDLLESEIMRYILKTYPLFEYKHKDFQFHKLATMLSNDISEFSGFGFGSCRCVFLYPFDEKNPYKEFVDDILTKFPINDNFIRQLLCIKLSVSNTKLPRGLGFSTYITLHTSIEKLYQQYKKTFVYLKLPSELIDKILSYTGNFYNTLLSFLEIHKKISVRKKFIFTFTSCHDISLIYDDYYYTEDTEDDTEDTDNYNELESIVGFDNIKVNKSLKKNL